MSICATIGKPIYTGFDVCIHDGFVVFEGLKVNKEFIYYFLEKVQKGWYRYGQPGTQVNLNSNIVSNEKIKFPRETEQQKIAAFLSSVDTKIEQLNRKKILLEQYKKGMMQKIFSQEIRFKDEQGKEYPDWEEKKLEEVASFSKGKGISKSDVTADGKQPCIRYGELYTLYNETIERVSSYTNVLANNLALSKANDVIIPASGETQEDIATASCVVKSGIALGGDLNILRSEMNGVFLSYYLNSAKKRAIAQISQGTPVVHLYSSQLKNLYINIPGIVEQQKIAAFLSAIDKKIELVAEQLKQAQTFKKGLLQQMLI